MNHHGAVTGQQSLTRVKPSGADKDVVDRCLSVILPSTLTAACFYSLGLYFPIGPTTLPANFPLSDIQSAAYLLLVGVMGLIGLYWDARRNAPVQVRTVELPPPPPQVVMKTKLVPQTKIVTKTKTNVVTKVEYKTKAPELEETDVYRLYDAEGQLLYIGIGARAQDRWRQHAIEKPWWHEVARHRTRRYAFRYQALAVEESAIKFEQPKYNIRPGGLTDHASDVGWHSPRHVDGVLPAPRIAKPLEDAGLPALPHDEPSSSS